jgi:hypothetical protein
VGTRRPDHPYTGDGHGDVPPAPFTAFGATGPAEVNSAQGPAALEEVAPQVGEPAALAAESSVFTAQGDPIVATDEPDPELVQRQQFLADLARQQHAYVAVLQRAASQAEVKVIEEAFRRSYTGDPNHAGCSAGTHIDIEALPEFSPVMFVFAESVLAAQVPVAGAAPHCPPPARPVPVPAGASSSSASPAGLPALAADRSAPAVAVPPPPPQQQGGGVGGPGGGGGRARSSRNKVPKSSGTAKRRTRSESDDRSGDTSSTRGGRREGHSGRRRGRSSSRSESRHREHRGRTRTRHGGRKVRRRGDSD